jgi:YYY domain-containing protein
MVELFQMWALVEVLGLMCLPLTITVFHNLPDRGWAFSKAIGMALLAFCVWLPLMTVQVLPFSQLFIAGVLIILLAFNIFGFLRVRRALAALVRANIFYIVVCEAIFLGMVFLLGWIRSYGPDIHNFEMFMDEGFLAAIMRSPHFPPNDMWLSGYSINYYYYAHFTIATLAKLLGQSPSIAFNTGISVFFGLTAVNLFGVTGNIVSWARYQRRKTIAFERSLWPAFLRRRQSAVVTRHNDANSDQPGTVLPSLTGAIPYGLLTILMGEVLGNLASTQQWWKAHDDLPPFYWFNTTRIIDKTINEFPAFSFLLSCFHAHVLALAFTIVAIALAFNLFLENGGDGKGKGLRVFGSGWRLPLNLGTTALILGGLFAMNGWDFPTYLTLAMICVGLQQWMAYQSRFRIDLVLDVFTVVAALTALSFFMYAPFYLSFVSPSQGIGIVSSADRSAIRDEVLIYGMFVFIYVSLLVVNLLWPRLTARTASAKNSRVSSQPGQDQITGNSTNLDLVSQEGVQVSLSSGRLTSASGPYATTPIRQSEEQTAPRNIVVVPAKDTLPTEDVVIVPLTGMGSEPPTPTDTRPPTHGRSARPEWLDMRVISIVLIFGVALLAFAIMKNGLTFVVAFTIAALGAALALYHLHDRPRAFTMLLGAAAFGLVALTEIVFLKDVFASNFPRMNTVFKFYFQAWALLSITSGAGLYFILDGFRQAATTTGLYRWVLRGCQVLWSAILMLFLLAGIVYPIVGSYQRTNHYIQRTNSLDGLNYLQSYDPSDYAAIEWLNSHMQGDPVIVEAYDPRGGDYSDYGRISALTGLPTLMGWVGHEYQWRVNWLNNANNANDFYRRGADINTIYTNTNPGVVLALMNQYNAQYLYVGPLEQSTYPVANLHRFSSFMQTVYAANGVTIYRVPQRS